MPRYDLVLGLEYMDVGESLLAPDAVPVVGDTVVLQHEIHTDWVTTGRVEAMAGELFTVETDDVLSIPARWRIVG